jgi:predicted dehydrogenase
MQQLRGGIVGCGDQHVLQAVSEQWRVSKRYQNYRDLLAQHDVDVVLIANPNAYRAKTAVAAVEAG